MIINNECYVSLELAKILKKAGFDWKCKNSSFSSAPTFEVVQRWLREVKNCYVSIVADCDSVGVFYTVSYIFYEGDNYNASHIWEKDEHGEDNHHRLKIFKTYEEAQEACIKKSLEIILKKEE